jgi:3-hydroxyisobutyrate dehydrogenase-like beta-hydroxyacid dehydrogenase
MSDDNALKSVIQQISSIESDLTKKTIVDTTTVHPDTTKEVAASLSQRGVLFVAAPVFGPPPSAETGELMMALAGPRREFLDVLAQAFRGVIANDVLIVSDLPEKAVLLKTLG